MICLRCCFKFIPVRVPFSKSTVFEVCRQKMCRFRVNRRPIRHIFHRFQNLPASCERSLKLKKVLISKALRLTSRCRSSYLKGASCRPFQRLTKMLSPIICFGSVLMDLITNWGGKSNFKNQLGPNGLDKNDQRSTLLPLQ